MFPGDNVVLNTEGLAEKVRQREDNFVIPEDLNLVDKSVFRKAPSLEENEAVFGDLASLGVKLEANLDDYDIQGTCDRQNQASKHFEQLCGGSIPADFELLCGDFTAQDVWHNALIKGMTFKNSSSISGIHYSDEQMMVVHKRRFYGQLFVMKTIKEELLDLGIISIHEE